MKYSLYHTVISVGVFVLMEMFLPCHVSAVRVSPPARAYKPVEVAEKVMIMPENMKFMLNHTSLSIHRNGVAQLIVLSKDISKDVLTDQDIIWKSNKESVAMVDKAGSVLGRKSGRAIITATLNGITVSCRVTVKKAKKLRF